jgi:hypothetical protein
MREPLDDFLNVHDAQLTSEDTQIIAAALLMWARLIPNGTAQDVAHKFLQQPVRLTSYDRDVMQEEKKLPASQRYLVQERCLAVAKKLYRSAH